MALEIIEYRDFRGGDWGRRQAWNAPKNSFKANNMLLYRTGELGIRPGLRNITPTGLVAGDVIGLSETPRNFNDSILTFAQGTALRWFNANAGNAVGTYTNTFTSTPDSFNYFNGGREVYISAGGAGVYKATFSTLTQLTASPIAVGIALFGDRLVINDQAPARNNLRYNGLTAGVSDFTSWPTTNVIPIGDNSELTSIDAQRTHLAIGKERQGIYIVTGQLGVNEALRQITTNKGPITGVGMNTARTSNRGILWYVDAFQLSPLSFDGTDYIEYKDLVLPSERNYGVAPFNVTDDDGVVFLTASNLGLSQQSPAQALVRYNGVWTQHTFNSPSALPIRALIQGVHGFGLLDPAVDRTNATALAEQKAAADTFVLVKETSGGVPGFYAWTVGLDRPGYHPNTTGSQYDNEDAGDDSAEQVVGSVMFPEYHDERGKEFMVREVIVDFRSWNSNGTKNNHFDLQVDCLRPYDNTSPITSLVCAWDEVASRSSTLGTIKRKSFMFGEQGIGNGYQLKFTNVRGIAIQRIQVIIEATKTRGI